MKRIYSQIISVLFFVLLFTSVAFAEFPTVEDRVGEDHTYSDPWSVDLPAMVNDEDRLILIAGLQGATIATPGGWELVDDAWSINGRRIYVFQKIANGTEGGGSVELDISTTSTGTTYIYRISGASDIEANAEAIAATTTPDLSSFNPSGWDTEQTLWILGLVSSSFVSITNYPSDYIDGAQIDELGTSYRENEVESEDPQAFTIDASDDTAGAIIAVKPDERRIW